MLHSSWSQYTPRMDYHNKAGKDETGWKPGDSFSFAWIGEMIQLFLFSTLPGEMIHFDAHIFQMGGSTTN